jgi:molybdopterin/thiamine biosynthesis adenylyltransferase/proteasome lid subunit RPN8/RPN11
VKYTLSIAAEEYAQLRGVTLEAAPAEGAAYLVCGVATLEEETRLVVREVIPVRAEHYLVRQPLSLSIASPSYAAVAKRAASIGGSVLFVHSHPGGEGEHSAQDDREEPQLMRFFEARIPEAIHGSAVVGDDPEFTARVWRAGAWVTIDRIRIVGSTYRFLGSPERDEEMVPSFFDRQVRAFGPDMQRLLSRLHIGVVGVGGTGSIVAEQLARLGVGTLSLFDHDHLEASNVTRVYGSTVHDAGKLKVDILKAHIERMGLGTQVHAYPHPITEEATARELRRCEIVFGCTDKEAPRAVLVMLALYYLIPVFDVGVEIKSSNGVMNGIFARLTILTPGAACLFCRRRITPETIALESATPEQRERLVRDGYAPELTTDDPAVITFTTAISTKATTELLARLTGAISTEQYSEYIVLFHLEKTIRTNTPPSTDCLCSVVRDRRGRGDRRVFLDMTWHEATPSEFVPI